MARCPGKVKRGGSVLFAPCDVTTDDEAGKTDGEQGAVGGLGNGGATVRLRKRSSGGGDNRDKGNGKIAEHAGNFQKETLQKS